jgi:hypothetical protein
MNRDSSATQPIARALPTRRQYVEFIFAELQRAFNKWCLWPFSADPSGRAV